MIQRCCNPNNPKFKNYGGRGIAVCERWRSYDAFLEDVGQRPTPAHTLDRIDNDGPYAPENCRWATRNEQARNMRKTIMVSAFGERKSLTDWAEQFGLHPRTVHSRILAGSTPEHALTAKKYMGAAPPKRIRPRSPWFGQTGSVR